MKIVVALTLTVCFLVVTLAVYYVHARFFPVEVILYSALLDAAIAAVLTGAVLFALPRRYALTHFEKSLLVVIWLLCGYAFAITVPTVIDRSLSVYILEKLDQRGGGIREDSFEQVFVDEYMHEYRLVDVRLTEQLESGTIVIENGCVKLTERGRAIVRFTRFFRQNFLARQRLLDGTYTDVLVDPLGGAPEGKVGYECD